MKRIQIFLSEEALRIVEEQLKIANENFKSGTINYSDLISEMVLNSKIDIKTLQLKKTDLRRSLRVLALQPDIDVESAIKYLNEIKQRNTKKLNKSSVNGEVIT